MQTSLGLANTAYQKPGGGIPYSDLVAKSAARPVVDIRDYITTGNTFNLAAVVAAMEASGGYCYVPPGNWTPTTYNVGLNNTAVSGGSYYQSLNTYIFKGAGKTSRIMFPTGMTTSDYLFLANSTSVNDFNTHWKVVFEDVGFSGANSPNGSLIKLYQRSVRATRVNLTTMLNGFVSAGYSDFTSLSQISADTITGWVYQGTGNGDGYVFDQIMAYACPGISLNNCLGATVRGCISGWHQFVSSDVVLEGNHIEGDGTTSSTANFLIKGSNVAVRSGYYEARKYRPTFQIDDVNDTLNSRVIFSRQVRFTQRLDDPASTYGALRNTDVDIQSLGKQGEITFESARSVVFGSSTAKPGFQSGTFLIPNVTATGVSSNATNIAAALTAAPLRVGSDFTIKYLQAAWAIVPNNGQPIPTTAYSQPFGSATAWAMSAGGYSTTLTAATYYYKIWVRDMVTRLSASSAEFSVTVDGTTTMPQLILNAMGPHSQVRIVRGTASGTYTQWAQVAASGSLQYLWDQGSHIGGTAWAAWSGTPAIPAAVGGQTRNGLWYPENGRSVFQQSSIPTDGQWLAGDLCWNTSGVGPTGWKCVTGGSPGVWVPLVAQSVVAKTTSYTATAADQIILCNATSGAITIGSPPAASVPGQVYTIKKTDSSANAVTFDPNASETIDAASTKAITTQNAVMNVISDGTQWWAIT